MITKEWNGKQLHFEIHLYFLSTSFLEYAVTQSFLSSWKSFLMRVPSLRSCSCFGRCCAGWQIAVLYPRKSLFAATWRGYQAEFNGHCVENEMDADLFHRFIVSLGTRRAGWRRSQGCECVARELKWTINLCPCTLRWICGRGAILTWDFWLRSTGSPDCVLPCSLALYKGKTRIQNNRLNQVKSV